MRIRSVAALAIACVVVAGVSLRVLRATNTVTLTLVSGAQDIPSAIGIDWLPTGAFADQLLISDNYATDVQNSTNFAHVSRTGAGHATWGAQSGWNNEIYFATVRPGQA